jgi:hypothetical protein
MLGTGAGIPGRAGTGGARRSYLVGGAAGLFADQRETHRRSGGGAPRPHVRVASR